MRVTRWGEYGVLCSMLLAKRMGDGRALTTATDIAQGNAIAVDYVQQIMQRLKRGGIIVSERGPHGGYLLARQPTEITLRDILFAAEGDVFSVMCEHSPLNPEFCSDDKYCALRGVWKDLQQHIDQFLTSYTLAELAEKYEPADVLVQLGRLHHEPAEDSSAPAGSKPSQTR